MLTCKKNEEVKTRNGHSAFGGTEVIQSKETYTHKSLHRDTTTILKEQPDTTAPELFLLPLAVSAGKQR